MSENKKISRRQFMSIAIGAIGALITAIFSIPAIVYVIGPALKREGAQNWIRLGSADKVEIGEPTLFKTTIERKTGWIVDEEELSVYIRTENGRDFIAMSNICTHLGCRVRWITDQESFFCPCHNAAFGKDGEVLSGPPPKPLDQYEVKAENGQLLILGG
jgi:menaquinol-cytochrome c reductase iron-sulfur subunit